jgi:hypothetical protein
VTDDQLAVHALPEGVPAHDSFAVRVRIPGGEWTAVPVLLALVRVLDQATGEALLPRSSVARFDFSGTVQVAVTSAKGAIGAARVRPLARAIVPAVDGDTVSFTLTEPCDLSIEIDGDLFDNLHLHACPLETRQPEPDDPDVLWFGPGLHTTPDDVLTVPDGKTVYLAGGAVLTSRVEFVGVASGRLLGRGVLWNAPGGVTVAHSGDVEIDGVLVLNPTGYAITVGQSRRVTIRGVHAYSHVVWGDGIDVFSSEDVVIDRVFLRNSDDCVAVYGHRWGYRGDVRNVVVRDSTLWADVAHPVNIGTHGDPGHPEVIENLVFARIEVLDHREPQMDYQGCFAFNPGDDILIRRVRIQDVHVEDFRQGRLISMRVTDNPTYNTLVGRGIEEVYIRNLTYEGTRANPSIIAGYDADHAVKDVTFQDLVVNGKAVSDTMDKPGWYRTSDFVPMAVNEHVSGLRFLDADTAASDDKPEVTSAGQAAGTVGRAFQHLVTASGWPTAFDAHGLPAGLTIDSATGLIDGAPLEPGTSSITVAATNSVGTATKVLTLTVHPPEPAPSEPAP